MKFLFDFDGIFTDPRTEAAQCVEIFNKSLLTLGKAAAEDAQAWIKEADEGLKKEKYSYGWRIGSNLSAFSFEDPFIYSIGMADYFDRVIAPREDKAKRVAGELLKHDIKAFGGLSSYAFNEMSKEKLRTQSVHPDREAVEFVRDCTKAGIETVVVSNSDSVKLESFFKTQGLMPNETPRLRGGARKFEVASESEKIQWGDFVINVTRPLYLKALEEEKPDAVFGDVLSLDLGLPSKLYLEKKNPFKFGLFLRKREYTPQESETAVHHARTKLGIPIQVLSDWGNVRNQALK